jgi:hypothetical protein
MFIALASTSFRSPPIASLLPTSEISAHPAASVEVKTTIVSDALKRCAMSAIGTKQTWAGALHMSAFDPKRTFVGRLEVVPN